MIRLSSLCPAYLFSFRFVRLLKLACPHPRRGHLELAGHTGDVLGQFAFWSRAGSTLPHIDVNALAHGRIRHPHSVGVSRADGGAGLSANVQSNHQRSDPALGYWVSLNPRRFVDTWRKLRVYVAKDCASQVPCGQRSGMWPTTSADKATSGQLDGPPVTLVAGCV